MLGRRRRVLHARRRLRTGPRAGGARDPGRPRRERPRPGWPRGPARRARPGEDRPDGRHRRHDPARAGRDHPLSSSRHAPRAGRTRHGEDGRRAAPRGVPPLHAPIPARAPGRARGRAEPAVPALHRAGAAVARRGGGHPVDGRRARAGDPRPRDRARPHRRAEGRRADGTAGRTRRPDATARLAARRADPLRRRDPHAHGVHDRGRGRPRASVGRVRTTSVTATSSASSPRCSRRSTADGSTAPSTIEEGDDLEEQLRRTPEFREALRRMWPRLAPHELIHDLLGALPLLRAAGKGLLSDAELELLHRARSDALDDVAWTSADAALVDEARTVLGPPACREAPGAADRRRRESCSSRPLRPSRVETTSSPAATATSSSTRSRTSRRCSCACSRVARSRGR